MLQTTFIYQLPVLYILNIHCVTEYGTKVRVETNNFILNGTNLANIMILGIFYDKNNIYSYKIILKT